MRSLIDVTDFTVEELYDLMKTAIDIDENPAKYAKVCDGKILATLFFEPSTRTRLSFESAMLRLGGKVIGFSEASSSSVSKGESVADTAKVVSLYADVIAMRHPKEGAPLVAARKATIPVINAGDGGHCHPTQTLADILTIYREKGKFDSLTVGLCGDLKYGRTTHSLINALSRYNSLRFVLISPEELELPSYVRQKAEGKNGSTFVVERDLEKALPSLDVLYMTRIQRERFDDKEEYERLKDSYVLTAEKMKAAKDDMIVLHPLPRVNEISVKVDDDKRAKYFEECENGRLMREALIIKLLKEKEEDGKNKTVFPKSYFNRVNTCVNPHCITSTEQEVEHAFAPSENAGKVRCIYCDAEYDE